MNEPSKPPATQSIVEVARATLTCEINELRAVCDRLDRQFELAVGALAQSTGKVVATGLGKSGLIARKIAATLCGTGTPAIFIHPVDALHGDLGAVQRDDTIILLSKSGETAEVLTFCDLVNAAGCTTIALVGNVSSSLAKRCQFTLDGAVQREACPLDLAPTSSALVATALGDALAACLVNLRGFDSRDFSRLHPAGSLGRRLLLRVRDVMHSESDLPAVGPSTILRDVLFELSSKAMGAVVVRDASGRLAGIFTDGDLRRLLQKTNSAEMLDVAIAEVMTRDPLRVRANQMAVEALDLMENRASQISVLPVLDEDDTVVGIVRIHDLVRAGL